ncbi:MAG: prepilin peptidase [Anaerovoracaceae bacterium]
MEFLNQELTQIIILMAVSIPLGIFLGHSLVYFFNKVPPTWFCDYNEKPSEELVDGSQRIKSVPWKLALSFFFICAGIKIWMTKAAALDILVSSKESIAVDSFLQGANPIAFTASLPIPLTATAITLATLIAIWALLSIAIADKKYMIIPDQYVILLIIVAIGFIPFQESIFDPLMGGLFGGGILLIIALVGKTVMKTDIMGMGDVKLCTALGLIVGFYPMAYILAASGILSGLFFLIGMIKGQLKRKELAPLGPYICASGIIYFLLF